MRPLPLLLAALFLLGCGGAVPPPPSQPAYVFIPKDLPGTPLEKVRAGVVEAKKNGLVPIVVFDLDGTIFDNGPRTRWLLLDLARARGDRALEKKILDLPSDRIVYDLAETLRNAGVSDPEILRAAAAHWRRHFFTDTGAREDTPLPGAVPFLRELHAAGATIVYLSARVEERMGEGTREALRRAGMPFEVERTRLLLRRAGEAGALDFKRAACRILREMGTVIAEFENEPENANLFAQEFPDAIHILLDTPHSPDAPAPLPGVVTIANYMQEKEASR